MIKWAEHVARISERRSAYKTLIGKPEGKSPLGRPRNKKENYIRIDLREIE
jgi:hypothetical protein